jgi:hypothetical protein
VKKLILITIFFGLTALLFAATILSSEEQPLRVLEKAHIAFENDEYGMALRLAEQAQQNKRKEYTWYSQTLTDALKPYQVQQAGNEIGAVLAILESRDAHDAVDIIRSFVNAYSAEYFHYSVLEIMAYIQKTYVYPEADFLIGNIYFYESEPLLAKEYFTRAWNNAFALNVPEEKYDILYRMSDLAAMQGDDELFEQSLLLVLADDPYYNNQAAVGVGMESAGSFYDSIKKALERNYTVDKIFQMYRANEYRSLRAYIALAKFYRDHGIKDSFLKTAVLGSLTSFTRMYAIVSERNVGYEYKGVESFFAAGLRYNDVVNWSIDQSVWDCFYYLFEAADDRNLNIFSSELLLILANVSPDIAIREMAGTKQRALAKARVAAGQ